MKTVKQVENYINIILHSVSNNRWNDSKYKPEHHSTRVATQITTVCWLSAQFRDRSINWKMI